MPLIFQYGSNCDEKRLNDKERLAGAADNLGRAKTIGEFDIAFNVWSQGNRCAASNLMPAPGTDRHAWGVLYDIRCELVYGRDRDGRKTLEQIEGSSYEPKRIRVRNEAGKEVEATTFVVKEDARRDGLWTSAAYVGHIVEGLRSHDVPEDYVQHVINVAIETNRHVTGAAAESQMIESLRTVNPSHQPYLLPGIQKNHPQAAPPRTTPEYAGHPEPEGHKNT